MLGPWRFGFAVLPHAGTWHDADVSRAAEQYQLPFVVAAGATRGAAAGAAIKPEDRAPTGRDAPGPDGISLEGDGVVLLALRRRGGELELRLLARTDRPTVAVIAGRPWSGARDVDLLGRPGAQRSLGSDGTLRLELGPWEIRTVRLLEGPARG
jgi:alpha-mannosidase